MARSSETASRKSPVTYSSGKSLIARLLLEARTSTRTVSPRATSCRATWLPRNPAAPVTSVVMPCEPARAFRLARPAVATPTSSRNPLPSDSSLESRPSHIPRGSSTARTADSYLGQNSPTLSFPADFHISAHSHNSTAYTARPSRPAHTLDSPTRSNPIHALRADTPDRPAKSADYIRSTNQSPRGIAPASFHETSPPNSGTSAAPDSAAKVCTHPHASYAIARTAPPRPAHPSPDKSSWSPPQKIPRSSQPSLRPGLLQIVRAGSPAHRVPLPSRPASHSRKNSCTAESCAGAAGSAFHPCIKKDASRVPESPASAAQSPDTPVAPHRKSKLLACLTPSSPPGIAPRSTSRALPSSSCRHHFRSPRRIRSRIPPGDQATASPVFSCHHEVSATRGISRNPALSQGGTAFVCLGSAPFALGI